MLPIHSHCLNHHAGDVRPATPLGTSRQWSWLIPFKLSAPSWLKARVSSFGPVADFEASFSLTSDNWMRKKQDSCKAGASADGTAPSEVRLAIGNCVTGISPLACCNGRLRLGPCAHEPDGACACKFPKKGNWCRAVEKTLGLGTLELSFRPRACTSIRFLQHPQPKPRAGAGQLEDSWRKPFASSCPQTKHERLLVWNSGIYSYMERPGFPSSLPARLAVLPALGPWTSARCRCGASKCWLPSNRGMGF